MQEELTLLAVAAHPDDESLGMGGTIARYSAEGVAVHVLTATPGDAGRHGEGPHPGKEGLARIRESELRAAAARLGARSVEVLGYPDGRLDEVDPATAVARIVEVVRRVRPQVVITFGPDGAYGHPDHIAVSQLATAALVRAPDPGYPVAGRPHAVSKFYYIAWDRTDWDIYQSAFKKLTSKVDGVERQAVPWPEWEITTRVDASEFWEEVWQAVQCHQTQMSQYGPLRELDESQHRALWGSQAFYRVFSLVNGGRRRETDLFEGLRHPPRTEETG